MLADHGRALDMPARPAFAPGTVPGRFTRFFEFPEGKVHWMALALVRRAETVTGPGFQFVELVV